LTRRAAASGVARSPLAQLRRRLEGWASTRKERKVALFVAKHQHSPDACPARDPQMGAMLLEHLSKENAREHGVEIHGEAVIEGQHTLYLIGDAPDRATVEQFLAPFAMAGDVEVLEANPCATVVGRAGC